MTKQKRQNSAVQEKKAKFEKNQRLQLIGRRVMDIGTLFLGNDRNSVIADKALSYF